MEDYHRESSRASDVLTNAADADEDKPIRCAKFRQQELWAWKPVWSPQVVVIMYLVVCVIFIPVGVVVLIQSSRLVSTPRLRYDNNSLCDVGVGESEFGELGPSKNCSFTVEIERNITAPSYFYYGIVNFYQNARRYVKSRSFDQLRGNEVSESEAEDCKPIITDENNKVIVPCGLVADSFFNDSFLVCRDEACNDPLNLNGTDIAWDVDRNTRFQPSEAFSAKANERLRSEDFMVWMRSATYRNWKKLYRRIEDDMPAGNYTVIATSRFPVKSFEGEKFFFISETSWFGGPNEILGVAYIVVGGASLILAISVLIKSRQSPDLDLPPETSVCLDGISPDVQVVNGSGGGGHESYNS